MSTFDRLAGMARKALDSRTTSRPTGSDARSGSGSDWRSMVRGAADAITGEGDRRPAPERRPATASGPVPEEDRRAIARYDYLVRTAEPDQLERVHREAFERLTPQQRTQLTASMRSELPESERPRTDAPQDLARSATRLGALDPRRLTRMLGRSGSSSTGAGTLAAGAAGAAGGLLGVVAGGAVATGIGSSLLQDAIGAGIDVDSLTAGMDADLGGFTDDIGGSISDAGDQVSGLGLGDLFGR